MDTYHFEDHAMNATSLSDIAGVYWSARDMDPSPIGNHHFITFIYESREQAERVSRIFGPKWDIGYHTDTNDRGLTIYYSTMGVGKDQNGKIRINFNPSSDLQSIHEVLKENNTSWSSADYDYEGHRMPLNISNPAYNTNEELMIAVLENIFKFQQLYKQGITIDYSLIDENCECTVNSIFKHCGYSRSDREELGEFSGTDWGEEDEIPDSFFDLTYEGNTHHREIHVPQCSWTGQIKQEHRTQFNNVLPALQQGYNGCAFCLAEIDTDIPPATPASRFTLHLISLHCRETEDITGADETYIKINGAIVWGPESINNNETRNISEAPVTPFATTIRVELYDQDLGLVFDEDDHIGGAEINNSLAGQGNREVNIEGDGAKYTLTFRVEQEP